LRRLPVIHSDGTLAGMLTRADLLQAVVTSPLMSPHATSSTQPLLHSDAHPLLSIQQQPIADYVNPAVVTVYEQASLDEVIDALILSPLKRVIVIDAERHVKGIISDVDVLARLQVDMRPSLLSLLTSWANGRQHSSTSFSLRSSTAKVQVAADVMNREVITVSETATVQETIEQMMTMKRKFLPVIDVEGQLVGTVGRSDLLRVLIKQG
jgi:CBS-domain-containing membrane protein